MSDYNVEMVNDDMTEFNVEFHGPRDSKQFSFIFSLVYLSNSFTLIFTSMFIAQVSSHFFPFSLVIWLHSPRSAKKSYSYTCTKETHL